ncbi:PIN domain-containing protein [Treponema denticola]|uniref:PIN domain-containing protein n=1 Tax=Treponema denticola TaxID=158 RepID=A0A9Q9EXJ3_TREDN|nr:PIN domain-containing protein [Treponema denticola]UTC89596.1 PIN domain-containing protein [Treponema denticola]UTD01053.1 PIN domain-containing protein [Treponema denticola]UTD05887.1 PIN domain-containing protein [Treponema denticola]
MIKKVFIDTDIILDVALAREPFFSSSKTILAMAENNIIIGNISSNCVANIYYILRKSGGDNKARKFILNIVKYITVIAIDHQNVLEALKSKFSDFEDALQHSSAVENRCEYIITRNIEDYKSSKIKVLLPEEFIVMFQ